MTLGDSLPLYYRRPNKRQCRESPSSWIDATDPLTVPMVASAGEWHPDSDFISRLFLDRLQKELVEGLQFSLRPKRFSNTYGSENTDEQLRFTSTTVKQMVHTGLNATYKILEDMIDSSTTNDNKLTTKTPKLLVVCCDVQPAVLVTHLRMLLRKIERLDGTRIPTLWLSVDEHATAGDDAMAMEVSTGGSTSEALGRILGTRRVGALCFCGAPTTVPESFAADADGDAEMTTTCGGGAESDNQRGANDIFQAVDSFVDYWRQKVIDNSN